MVVIQHRRRVRYFRHSGELARIIPQDISCFRSKRQQGFWDIHLFPIIMRTKAFRWSQFNLLFLPGFHAHYFSLQRWKDLVPTLNKLADVAVVDPGRAGNAGHILEGDFRAFYDPRTLGLGRTRGTCLWSLSPNTVSPKECHASKTENETGSCIVMSSHTRLPLESLAYVVPFPLL